MDEHLAELGFGHVVFVNAVWVSTGLLGCLFNATLFTVVLLNTAKGFYRKLLLLLALIDLTCSFSNMFYATWFYKIDNIVYSVSHGIGNTFPAWLIETITWTWILTFYGELVVITYTFIWRAVLISNSKNVHYFEHTIVIIPLAVVAGTISYFDYYGSECCVEYVDLSPSEVISIMIPATLIGLHFVVIVICALYILYKIKSGSMSNKANNTHKKSLFVLSVQALNPLFFNFFVILIYETALIAPIPAFLVNFIPCSSIHPILNPLIILTLTTEHRKFLFGGCSKKASPSSSIVSVQRRKGAEPAAKIVSSPRTA